MPTLDDLASPALVQRRLLKLWAVYAKDDDYLEDGYHLRWMPDPTLGFPRRGFLLSLRESPSPELDLDDPVSVAEAKLLGSRPPQGSRASWFLPDQSDLGLGVRISRLDGSTPSPQIANGLTLEFVDSGGAFQPAARVALRVSSGSGGSGEIKKVVARAGSRLGQDQATVSKKLKNKGQFPRWIPISAGLIDSVTIEAAGGGELRVDKVRWLPADPYADDEGWEAIDRFLLPYQGDGENYPESMRDAQTRLEGVGLEQSPPWREGGQIELTSRRLKQRYISDGNLTELKKHLGKMLSSETGAPQPQRDYMIGDPDGAELRTGGASSGDPDLDGVKKGLEVPAVQFLLGASVGTPFAHVLGLAHFLGAGDDDGQYDFKVSAVYPRRWWKEIWERNLSEQALRDVFPNRGTDGSIVPPPLSDDSSTPRELLAEGEHADFFRVASIVTDVGPDSALTGAVPEPERLSVDLENTPGREPVPVEATVEWSLPRANRQDREAPVVGYMAERYMEYMTEWEDRDPETVLLDGRERDMDRAGGRSDQETAPRLIRRDKENHQLRDAGLREEGDTIWRVYLMDWWGRWSEPQEITENVQDRNPPPPPSGLTAEFEGELDDPGAGDDNAVAVEFKYSKDLVSQAPDLRSFEIYLEEGIVEGEPEGTGEDDEDREADHTVFVEIGRADDESGLQSATVDEDGASARVIYPSRDASAEEDDRSSNGEDDRPKVEKARRVRVVDMTGPTATQGRRYHWHTTALVRAVDMSGNASVPATAVATYVESREVSTPDLEVDAIEYTTWPDADGYGWWRCEWDSKALEEETKAFEEGTRIQVLRTSESRLLAEADGTSREDLPESSPERADELRELAIEYPAAFAPDHPESYEAGRGYHDVAVDAKSRDLHLVVVIPTGPTGERSKWPESKTKFAVIAARQLAPVPQPRLNARSEGLKVHLDLSVMKGWKRRGLKRLRVWRWRPTESDTDDLPDDLREMRPLRPIELEAEDSGSEPEPRDSESEEVSFVDEGVQPSTWYAYRAVAETRDGRRSSAIGPVWVRTGELVLSGKVVDAEMGDPLSGAKVEVVDADLGTITASDGTFRLDLRSREATLRVSLLGYEQKTVAVEGRSEITVQLSPTA